MRTVSTHAWASSGSPGDERSRPSLFRSSRCGSEPEDLRGASVTARRAWRATGRHRAGRLVPEIAGALYGTRPAVWNANRTLARSARRRTGGPRRDAPRRSPQYSSPVDDDVDALSRSRRGLPAVPPEDQLRLELVGLRQVERPEDVRRRGAVDMGGQQALEEPRHRLAARIGVGLLLLHEVGRVAQLLAQRGQMGHPAHARARRSDFIVTFFTTIGLRRHPCGTTQPWLPIMVSFRHTQSVVIPAAANQKGSTGLMESQSRRTARWRAAR